jgi:hypothetical protein
MPANDFASGAVRKARRSRGQVIVLATILVLLFVLIAAVLIDVYHLEEARNWGYNVAQNSAMAGVSLGRDWNSFEATLDPMAPVPTPREDKCVEPGKISLSEGLAWSTANEMCNREMDARGITGYSCTIHVLPLPNGGAGEPGWPPDGRLGGAMGDWHAHNPAVAVYVTFPVHTFFMSIVGRSSVEIHVFAAAESSQPLACPTFTPGP